MNAVNLKTHAEDLRMQSIAKSREAEDLRMQSIAKSREDHRMQSIPEPRHAKKLEAKCEAHMGRNVWCNVT